ncbi:hypothetical protein [Streptomyces sp. NPDC051183]|uniref:hypothetical protein n=1 Tax=unclassified Streptomyces TaxID=2593676 RepID=UPI00342EA998
MRDFVDRVLGLPDPSAVRPRIPSFFDLPPMLDPPLPALDAERDAAVRLPPAEHPAPQPRAGADRAGGGADRAPAPAAVPYVPAPAGEGPGRGTGRPEHDSPPDAHRPASRRAGAGPARGPGGEAAASPAPRAAAPGRPAEARLPAPAPERPLRAAVPPVDPPPRAPLEARAGLAQRSRGPAAAPAPQETTVHITIGRLEIRSGPPRAAAAEPAATRRPPREPAVPLEDYLRRRSGGAR